MNLIIVKKFSENNFSTEGVCFETTLLVELLVKKVLKLLNKKRPLCLRWRFFKEYKTNLYT